MKITSCISRCITFLFSFERSDSKFQNTTVRANHPPSFYPWRAALHDPCVCSGNLLSAVSCQLASERASDQQNNSNFRFPSDLKQKHHNAPTTASADYYIPIRLIPNRFRKQCFFFPPSMTQVVGRLTYRKQAFFGSRTTFFMCECHIGQTGLRPRFPLGLHFVCCSRLPSWARAATEKSVDFENRTDVSISAGWPACLPTG